ncbi:MAG: endonuclease/exonuclease/phosphatase family protein [Bacteroidales bacterium]|jgi:endonuclease/exonuclease/phosphatase (EEP) superfamily protein YafD|nr:endonuclease/exonuclease/phosphatase family protein [Bacteroidales bacterium]
MKKPSRWKKFFRILLVIGNIVVAAGLLLAYACCRINPEKLWWIGFFGLAYLWLLVANLVFIALWWLVRPRKYMLLSLVVILSGWNVSARNIRLSGRSLPENRWENSFKMLSFNVHMFRQNNVVQADGTKLDIIDFFSNSGADLICMQEFSNAIQPDRIGEQLQMSYHYVELTSTSNLGIATFSRFPIVNRQLIYADNSVNGCIYTDVLIHGDTVRVFNLHLKSIGFGNRHLRLLNNALRREYSETDVRAAKSIVKQMVGAAIRRSRQVAIVERYITQSPYPVVICGDFNDPPVSYSYQRIRGDLRDAFIDAGSGRSTTYDIGTLSSQRIDYILHAKYFQSYDYESPHIHLSDHHPVICRLKKQVGAKN